MYVEQISVSVISAFLLAFLPAVFLTYQYWRFGILSFITACAIATSCCINVVPFQLEKGNFHPTAPHLSTDLSETQN